MPYWTRLVYGVVRTRLLTQYTTGNWRKSRAAQHISVPNDARGQGHDPDCPQTVLPIAVALHTANLQSRETVFVRGVSAGRSHQLKIDSQHPLAAAKLRDLLDMVFVRSFVVLLDS